MGELAPVQSIPVPAPQTASANGFLLQRKCACGSYGTGGECDKCRDEKSELQRKAGTGAEPEAMPAIVHDVLRSAGQPLDGGTRAWMEPRFGHDFSGVRVHTDARAAESAQAVNALAYTVGRDVVFGTGQYAPGTERGSRLLAHELTHVAQQAGGKASPARSAKMISQPSDAAEVEADAAANRVMSGESVQVTEPANATLHAALSPDEKTGLAIGGVALGVGALVGIGIGIAALAGAFDKEKFSDTELQAYLTLLATHKRIEDNRDSDNKARDLVRRWDAGDAAFNVDKGFSTKDGSVTGAELKHLLIEEMLSGVVTKSDQLSILVIFRKSSAADVEQLLTPTRGLSIQDFEKSFSSENLAELYKVIKEKLPNIGEPQLKKGDESKSGACTVGRALKINFAHKRAEELVNNAVNLLDQFQAKPGDNKSFSRILNMYFHGATQDQIATIRANLREIIETLPKINYVCPDEPFTEFKATPKGGETVVYKKEEGVQARAIVDMGVESGKSDDKDAPAPKPRTFNVILFPEFFDATPREQARAAVHEPFHHAKMQGDDSDKAYGAACEKLDIATALVNADSHAMLVMSLEFGGPQVTVTDCPVSWQGEIVAATRTAETWINNALTRVNAVMSDPKNAEPFVVEQLKAHFKIAPTDYKELHEVWSGLTEMQSGFAAISFECETSCSEDETSATAGYVNGILWSPRAGRIHLCPYWFEKLEHETRVETIAHEMAHRFAGKTGEVYRKANGHTYAALPTSDSLENADSFAQFARTVFAIGARHEEGSTPEGEAEEKSTEKSGEVKRKAIDKQSTCGVPASVHEVLDSAGKPLDTDTRAYMEPLFDYDFSDVRVHSDAGAAQAAQGVNAHAYTVGNDVVFGAGKFEPQTTPGRELLAHELTHVVQQIDTTSLARKPLEIAYESGPEKEADRVGEQIARGETLSSDIGNAGSEGLNRHSLQRKPDTNAPEPEQGPELEPEAKAPPEPQPIQFGGIPVQNPGRGLGGNPAPPDCLDFLWAREYNRVFRLDTISVIGLSARAADETKKNTRDAYQKNEQFKQNLADVCTNYAGLKQPLRVRFYFVDSDLRDAVGKKIETEDAESNRNLGNRLGAGQMPKVLVYLERERAWESDFSSDSTALKGELDSLIKDAGTSGAMKGLKKGALVAAGPGLVAFGLTAAVAGLGWGLLAGAAVVAVGAGLGALIGGLDEEAKLTKGRIDQVKKFVALLRATGEVKGDELTSRDSDNLARNAVTLWIDDPSGLPLTVKDRRLLIRVMLDGPTLSDDERAIIKLLENSTDAEVLQILDTTASPRERVTMQDLDDNIQGREWVEMSKMLRARFPSLGAPEVQRTSTESTPVCDAEQAIMILEARKRATQIVPIASQRIGEHLANPQPDVLNRIQCYFPLARRNDIVRIKSVYDQILQLIPSSRYVCPHKKTITVNTPMEDIEVNCTSGDVAQTLVPQDEKGVRHALKETYLCGPFFAQGPEYQATTLVHEWFHRAVPEPDDIKYDPKCGSMELNEALNNADSFALLASELAQGRAPKADGIPFVTVGNFRNTGSVTPENRCLSCTQIPSLGPDPATGANLMEVRGDITGHRPDALYDFKRTKEVIRWKNVKGEWIRDVYEPPGSLDDASAADEDTAPKDDRIYSIDGPGLHAQLPSVGDPTIDAGVYKGNFIETVNVKVGDDPWTQSSNSFPWHSITWFERGDDGLLRRTPSDNEIEPGSIAVNEPLPYGPGDYEMPDPEKGVPV